MKYIKLLNWEPNKHYIYCHTNIINQKKYVGQCIGNPWRRWRPNGEGYCSQEVIYRAIQKYGWGNFTHTILEEVDTQQEANAREKYWIKFYHSYIHDPNGGGYNMTKGGDNELQELWKDPQYRQKMCVSFSKHRKEAFTDPDYAAKILKPMLDGIQAVWSNPEWRKARIENITGDKNPNAKAVKNIETGKIFNTIAEAAEWAGLNSVSGIGQCCRKKQKTSGVHPITNEKLHWQFVKEVVVE